MAVTKEYLVCSTRNVSVAVPRDWWPEIDVVRAMSSVSQITLNALRLNFGRARVTFVADDAPGQEGLIVRTPDRVWDPAPIIFVPSGLRTRVAGLGTDDNVIGHVAAAAASSRYVFLHPFASEKQRIALQERARDMSLAYMENARKSEYGTKP